MTTLTENIQDVKLTRLTPEQVLGEWVDYISPAVENILPDLHKNNMEAYRKFASYVDMGNLMVFVIGGERPEENSVSLGIVILTVNSEKLTNRKQLVIWSLHAWNHVPDELWKKAWMDLEGLASDLECDTIIGHTNIDRVKEIFEFVGAKPTQTLYVKELK